MTPVTFRAALRSLGLTIEGFAALTDQHPVTCRCWGKARSGREVQAFPAWVGLLLAAWAAHPEAMPR